MPPVEGERSFNQNFVTKLDSTEPGDEQNFDLDPAYLIVECDEDDSVGKVTIINKKSNIRLLIPESSGNRELPQSNQLSFSGSEKVIIEKTIPDTDFTEEITLWHHTGEAEQPPYRSERVPLSPAPPPEEKAVELVPEQERELVTAVSN